MNHSHYDLPGNYCFICRESTVCGTPGWPRRSRDDSPITDHTITDVVWADGTRDVRSGHGGSERQICVMCQNPNCPTPVHTEQYKEIGFPKSFLGDNAKPIPGYPLFYGSPKSIAYNRLRDKFSERRVRKHWGMVCAILETSEEKKQYQDWKHYARTLDERVPNE